MGCKTGGGDIFSSMIWDHRGSVFYIYALRQSEQALTNQHCCPFCQRDVFDYSLIIGPKLHIWSLFWSVVGQLVWFGIHSRQFVSLQPSVLTYCHKWAAIHSNLKGISLESDAITASWFSRWSVRPAAATGSDGDYKGLFSNKRFMNLVLKFQLLVPTSLSHKESLHPKGRNDAETSAFFFTNSM